MRPGDPAAPAVPDDHRARLAERADDAGDVGGRGAGVVAARRLVGGAVAAQVHRDRAVAGLGERRPAGAARPTRTAGTRAAAAPAGPRPARRRGSGRRWPRRSGAPTGPSMRATEASRLMAWYAVRLGRGRVARRLGLSEPGLSAATVSWACGWCAPGLPLTFFSCSADQREERGDEEQQRRSTMRKASPRGQPDGDQAVRPCAKQEDQAEEARRTPAAANIPAPVPACLASACDLGLGQRDLAADDAWTCRGWRRRPAGRGSARALVGLPVVGWFAVLVGCLIALFTVCLLVRSPACPTLTRVTGAPLARRSAIRRPHRFVLEAVRDAVAVVVALLELAIRR